MISEVKHSLKQHISDFENQKSKIIILYSIPEQAASVGAAEAAEY
ncbi:MAG: hypothetical protein QGG53_42260 [Planctomycetota bacterium]|nr:hypothetical protein [Planctomycetota bacterium]